MGIVRAQVKFDRDNLLAEDAVVNTWHFFTESVEPTPVEAQDIVDQLNTFYTEVVPGFPASIANRMARYLVGPAHVKLYDLADNLPRIPILDATFPIVFPTVGMPLPAEVAIVLSLRAELQSGVDARRLRGRVYLGPWNAGNRDDTDTADARPPLDTCQIIAGAAKRMLDAGLTAGQPRLIVWSETSAGGNQVTKVRVNNAWDTQRRRGSKPTHNVEAVRAG